jgi:hypothetical protein
MKKIISASAILLCSAIAGAQPWMQGSTGPVHFRDAVNRYEQYFAHDRDNAKEEEQEGGVKESPDHLFEKWKWYWSQHLDSNGYIVPPMKAAEEWERYMKTVKSNARMVPKVSDWVFQGPSQSGGGYSGLGRINVVAYDPVDSNTFYVGSAGGGAWKTTNNGSSWTNMYDFLPTLGVADIKVNPQHQAGPGIASKKNLPCFSILA